MLSVVAPAPSIDDLAMGIELLLNIRSISVEGQCSVLSANEEAGLKAGYKVALNSDGMPTHPTPIR